MRSLVGRLIVQVDESPNYTCGNYYQQCHSSHFIQHLLVSFLRKFLRQVTFAAWRKKARASAQLVLSSYGHRCPNWLYRCALLWNRDISQTSNSSWPHYLERPLSPLGSVWTRPRDRIRKLPTYCRCCNTTTTTTK